MSIRLFLLGNEEGNVSLVTLGFSLNIRCMSSRRFDESAKESIGYANRSAGDHSVAFFGLTYHGAMLIGSEVGRYRGCFSMFIIAIDEMPALARDTIRCISFDMFAPLDILYMSSTLPATFVLANSVNIPNEPAVKPLHSEIWTGAGVSVFAGGGEKFFIFKS